MRKRTTSASSCGSKWTSEAPSSAAWKMIELTRRTSGASETPSSASRSSVSSSSSSNSSSASSSTARAPKASEARAMRRSSARMSSRDATPSSSGWRVASRSSSIPCRVRRVGDATCSTPLVERVRHRDRRARARGAGSASPRPRRRPSERRSTSGSWWRAASSRAMPSLEATPSSTSACASEPSAARGRARARAVGRDEPGRGEQVGDELGRLVDAIRRRDAARRGGVPVRLPPCAGSTDARSVSLVRAIGRSRAVT